LRKGRERKGRRQRETRDRFEEEWVEIDYRERGRRIVVTFVGCIALID